jgi:hypothetical protein
MVHATNLIPNVTMLRSSGTIKIKLGYRGSTLMNRLMSFLRDWFSSLETGLSLSWE